MTFVTHMLFGTDKANCPSIIQNDHGHVQLALFLITSLRQQESNTSYIVPSSYTVIYEDIKKKLSLNSSISPT